MSEEFGIDHNAEDQEDQKGEEGDNDE